MQSKAEISNETPERLRAGSAQHKRVTLKDIAAHAGVSRSTVSLVMQKSPLVAEATRARVRQSASTLGYVYNRGAAMMRSSRTATVGVLVHDIANPFFATMVAGIDDVLQREHYVPFLTTSGDSPARQQRLIDRLREHRVDALLLCPAEKTPDTLLHTVASWGMPCIEVLRHAAKAPVGDYVGADIRQGVEDAVAHLTAQGHRRIALLVGDGDHSADRQRYEGYYDAMHKAGLESDIRIERGELTRSAGLERTLALLKQASPPTALICHNDLVALGALLALERLGITPGYACAVVGIDDIDEAALAQPGLSSIATQPFMIGQQAAQLALQRIREPQGSPRRIALDAPLRIRASSLSKESI